jgi:glycosyltransferase involved in cell wall biosynthesis
MKKVSIIIPFHNRIDWTKEAIQSVIDQTYQNFEIILIDDGSEGNYETEIRQLDKRIIYFRQPQGGPSSARNVGIRASTGDFIAFLDSDDIFLPEKLCVQLEKMEEHPDLLFSHTSYYLIDEQNNQLGTIDSGKFNGSVYPTILGNCPIATPTVMIRKEAFQNTKFNENIRIGEDILVWAQISKFSNILGIDRPLTKVRIHGHNAVNDPEKQRTGLENIITYGLLADNTISIKDRNHMLSDLHFQIGITYFKQNKYSQAAINFARSVLGWFPNIRSLEILVRIGFLVLQKLIPKPVRNYLKHIVTNRQIK